jgi:two-component system, NtrC family, response regulator AtoC
MNDNHTKKFRVLVIDDEFSIRDVLKETLELSGFLCDAVSSGKEGLKALRGKEIYHLVITDIRLPDISGLDVLDLMGRKYPFIPVIIITGFATIESTKEAMRRGAVDYIPKPFTSGSVVSAVDKAIRSSQIRSKDRSLPQIIYESTAMEQVMRMVQRVSRTDSTVLITGESGTGKELVARAVHRMSKRSTQQFISVNSGALPEGLLESELFGHVKGAFTGAITTSLGRFQVADGGTLFLDEVGNMSRAMQVKLLRVLQDGEFSPVGSSDVLTTDSRLIAATNVDLRKAVAETQFREDLFYRLNVIEINLPPLRERTDDILPLAEHFLNGISGSAGSGSYILSADAASALLSYSWPGNIRELENTMERAAVMCEDGFIDAGDLPERLLPPGGRAGRGSRPAPGDIDLDSVLANIEKRYIMNALMENRGNRTDAAKVLGLKRTTLLARMSKLGLAPDFGKE